MVIPWYYPYYTATEASIIPKFSKSKSKKHANIFCLIFNKLKKWLNLIIAQIAP